MKKVLSFALAAMLVLCLFSACGGTGTPDVTTPGTPNHGEAVDGYSISVLDAFGKPCTDGVIVRFMQNGAQVKMQKADENGKVSVELPDGEYTVELKFVDAAVNYYYDQSDLTLNKDKKSLSITLYSALPSEPVSLVAPTLDSEIQQNVDAYELSIGSTYVTLTQGVRNYFLFTPAEAGLYHISAHDTDAVLGYYGASYYVQRENAAQPEGGIFEVNIKPSMIVGGTTSLVIGLDATGTNTTGIINIQRAGDHVSGDEDVPYQTYEAKTPPVPYTLPAGTKTEDFDLTADGYTLVLGEDNFYHLDTADGPLVLVRIGKDSGGSQYLAPLEEMATKAIMGKYFYNENGSLDRKEAYNQCIQDYAACADEATGMYPLTEDLKYIIQQRGDHYGWFDADRPEGYVFIDDNGNPVPGINPEISWLLFSCYIVK